MKKVLTYLFLFIPFLSQANEIDKLQTNKDVEQFLGSKINVDWRYVSPFEDNKTSKTKFTKAGFLKIDIDSNGLTDLLIYGQNCFVVLDTGGWPYVLRGDDHPPYNLETGEAPFYFTDIIMLKNKPLLIFKRSERQGDTTHYLRQSDTVIFKFGEFIEYNANPEQLKIEEIRFSSDGDYGGDIFEMKIDASRRLIYKTHSFQNGWTDYYTTLDKVDYEKLIQIISYVKLNSLNDHYAIENAVDFQAYTLEVKFKDGKTKKIYDYGGIGPSGLQCVYTQLFYLQKAKYWD